MWLQKEIRLTAPSRGFHLVTSEIERQLPELHGINIGLCNLFIKHTSASLSINENCDPDVRDDLEKAFNRIVPEAWNRDIFKHTMEGDDDMPAHVKCTMIGSSINVPITKGKFNLGTWQGLYLCEHRNAGGYGGGHERKIVVTIQGTK
ncbi:unnamed protein product [Albugo candida]|uniref:Secondary thiamine-phosphate synthase enzyme n=1 Tax=Albugo candida TaxID=65357 RepID=A0A024GMR8_9STRA|nr:unnamed protein product [Albugo candida]|eukprot:CCI48186.1 unnamed protein product [Albugo candida]